MQPELGALLEGKVTGITKFGAFVTMPDGTSGLVHISEIADVYVSDVNDYLKMGQPVKVRVVGITPEGKINLSIKKAAPRPPRPREHHGEGHPPAPHPAPHPAPQHRAPRPASPRDVQPGEVYPKSGDRSFEDKLKQFMQDSDSRISDNRLYSDRKGSRRRR